MVRARVVLALAVASSAALAQTPPPVTSSRFVTDQARSELRASRFVGIEIYGSDDQTIGVVDEVLTDALGRATTVVIGVGGFLGIGEKTIAVPFTSLEWVMARRGSAVPTAGPDEQAAYRGRPDHAVAKLSRADLRAAPTFKYYAQTHPAPDAGSRATTSPPVKP